MQKTFIYWNNYREEEVVENSITFMIFFYGNICKSVPFTLFFWKILPYWNFFFWRNKIFLCFVFKCFWNVCKLSYMHKWQFFLTVIQNAIKQKLISWNFFLVSTCVKVDKNEKNTRKKWKKWIFTNVKLVNFFLTCFIFLFFLFWFKTFDIKILRIELLFCF